MKANESLQIMRLQMDAFFRSGVTLPIEFRKQRLQNLKKTIRKNESKIFEALKKDLNKSDYESMLTELGLVYSEIDTALKNMAGWAKVRHVFPNPATIPSSCYTVSEPLGVVLIISPWNYPFMLTLCPLIGAVAAGNCVVVKPAEVAASSAQVIQSTIDEAFAPDYCRCVRGSVDIATELLSLKWDHIFFTGSTRVGKIVMQAAALHLTPVTLELGGKSPVICHHDADIKSAARRIAWGKLLNAGQTCIAPDYLFVHKDIHDALVSEMGKCFDRMVPAPLTNGDYPKIITAVHFTRLISYLKNADILYGGAANPETGTVAPTLIRSPDLNAPVMVDEIFGPILPVFQYTDIQEPLEVIRERPKPLALYLFTYDRQIKKTVLEKSSFGGGCINDTLLQISHTKLPFGGVGDSGMGHYHGKYSFDTFSHRKSMVEHNTKIENRLRFPPFRRSFMGLLRKFI